MLLSPPNKTVCQRFAEYKYNELCKICTDKKECCKATKDRYRNAVPEVPKWWRWHRLFLFKQGLKKRLKSDEIL